jgi:uncharacterized glyoxalase superfamily protein PhnB
MPVFPQAPAIEQFRPFVPAKDFTTSKQFYQHIGFSVDRVFSDSRGATLSLGASTFILQSFFVKEHAENYMMQLVVRDIGKWWQHIQAAKLSETFGVVAPKAPQMQPWGIVVCYVVDPSGVLWHVVPAPV